jgi:AraC-like DNA-binding protein/quercetin dioxygenase-like cupin family protein
MTVEAPGANVIEVHWQNAYSIVQPQITADGVHKWPFDPSFPIDIRYFAGDRRCAIEMNRHDYFEIVYVMSGTTTFKIEKRTFDVRKGDLVIVGPDLYHTNVTSSSVGLACLYFAPELILSSCGNEENAGYLVPFLRQGANFPHVISKHTNVPKAVFNDMQRILSELPAASSRARLSVRTYLKYVLVSLLQHYAGYLEELGKADRNERSLRRLKPIFDLIEGHSHETLQIRDAARACGMSKSRFMSFFKTCTGETFLSYLNCYRISKAQELLRNTGHSVSEIAQEVGFCDQSHFGFTFRKASGISPFAYRQLCRESGQRLQVHRGSQIYDWQSPKLRKDASYS